MKWEQIEIAIVLMDSILFYIYFILYLFSRLTTNINKFPTSYSDDTLERKLLENRIPFEIYRLPITKSNEHFTK